MLVGEGVLMGERKGVLVCKWSRCCYVVVVVAVVVVVVGGGGGGDGESRGVKNVNRGVKIERKRTGGGEGR